MGLLQPAHLTESETETILREKLRWILTAPGAETCEPRAVIVFGSAARGEMTESSDVDIALVYPDAKSLKAGRAAIYRRPPPDSWPMDLLFATEESFRAGQEKGGLFELVMSEGRVVHGSLE